MMRSEVKGNTPSLYTRVVQLMLACMAKDSLRMNLVYFLLALVIFYVVFYVYYVSRDLFPETDMVINSNCKNPIQNWDGKVLNVPVWSSAYSHRPQHYNLHYEKHDEGVVAKSEQIDPEHSIPIQRPIIVWATHHKTGTFLAKKIFSKVCARMQWCCIFHVTRDSVHAVTGALHDEPVNAMGHSQWIWHPKELNITNYRFIHFYRHPFRKVISGFNYHYDGTEEWTKKSLKYSHICANTKKLMSTPGAQQASQQIVPTSREHVHAYCESTHLCETCCRREHEIDNPENMKTLDFNHKTFQLRRKVEYDYMCDYLGSIDNETSIQTTFHTLPAEKGILIEAALDFYENLRMANLINQTVLDNHAINIDLDFLTSEYDQATLLILKHLKDFIPREMIASLHDELKFYDLNSSPMYRWSMSNPVINHVTSTKTNEGHGKTSKELMQILVNDARVKELYAPVLEKMHAVLPKKKN